MNPEVSDYCTTINIVNNPVNLHNASTCIPADQFVMFAQMVVFKTDAIKLGIVCFFAGMAYVMLLNYVGKRWNNGK